MSETYRQYVRDLEQRVEQLRAISKKAREKGVDPSLELECKIARDIADLVEGLVGPEGVAESIRKLSSKLRREEIAFYIHRITEPLSHGTVEHELFFWN